MVSCHCFNHEFISPLPVVTCANRYFKIKVCFKIQIENTYAVLKTFPVFSFESPKY